jgi:hypothetical protein
MKRNDLQKIKKKLTLKEIAKKELSFKKVVEFYFPSKNDSELDKILWSNTDFPYVENKQKIVDQIYLFYIKSTNGSVNPKNRKISAISF